MEPRQDSSSTSVMVLVIFALWCIFTGLGNPVNPSTACSGCATIGSNAPVSPSPHSTVSPQGGLTEDEIQFRTDLVKMKILEALNLEEPPNVTTPLPDIPYKFDEMSFQEKREDKRTSVVFLIGSKVSEGCEQTPESVCYRIQKEGKSECGIKSEKLWIFVQNSTVTWNNLLVFENHENGSIERIAKFNGNVTGWVPIKLHPWYWVGASEEKSRIFTFSYQHSSTGVIDQLVRTFEQHSPLIELATESCSSHNRQKRSVTTPRCARSRNPQCCLQEFTVNFTAIGWNWILVPRTVSANYCQGSCNAHILSDREENHRYIMYRSYGFYKNPNMLPCCVAVEKTSLHVIVFNSRNNSVEPKRIPGLSALGCECY
nr:inhibin [Holothuria scabra]